MLWMGTLSAKPYSPNLKKIPNLDSLCQRVNGYRKRQDDPELTQ